jgi:hypothetical protein
MSVTLTVRGVPEHVRDALTDTARGRGQSLQAFLLVVLNQQAAFSRNAQILTEIDQDLASGGGARVDAPDAAELLEQGRLRPAGADRGRRGSRPAA